MKKIILGMAAALTLAACNEQGGNPTGATPAGPVPPPPPVVSEEGGISSGGGGTLPADPASIWQIRDIMRDAKRDLRLYFRYEKYYGQNSPIDDKLAKKILLGNYSVLEALEQTDLELLMDKPCLDAKGKEVDGSVHASRPNTICISAFRIAPKVAKQLARNEVIALIAHEISHLVGASEAEAVEFQKNTLFHFDHFKIKEQTSEYYVDEVHTKSSYIQGSLKDVIEKFETYSDEALSDELDKIQKSISEFYTKLMGDGLRIYLKPQADYMSIQIDRYMMGLWYSHSLVPGKEGDYWRSELDELFGQDLALSPDEFSKRRFPTISEEPSTWPNELIARIQTKDDLKKLLVSMKDYFDDQSTYIWQFKFSHPLAKLLVGPWTVPTTNPWEKFVGEYSVVDRQCVNDGYQSTPVSHVVGVNIINPDYAPTELRFRELSEGGWGDSALADNGYAMSGLVRVEGNASSAKRISEKGQTWFGDWSKRVDTFEMVQGSVIWNVRLDSKSAYTEKTYYVECTVKLQKK